MTKLFLASFTLAILFSACSPQEENSSEPTQLSEPDSGNTRNPDSISGNRKTQGKKDEVPVDETGKKTTANNWRELVKEYHEIVCRQHNGVNTTTDKVRLNELTSEFALLQINLPVTERSDFIAEKAKAMETESCP